MIRTVRRRRGLLFGMILALLAACIHCPGEAASGKRQLLQFRVRPVIERADMERADGTVFIGARQGKQQTAQMHIGTTGRSPGGNETDLAALIKKTGGRVEHAFWRAEARESLTDQGQFVLWPVGNAQRSMPAVAFPGWNLWDVTDWMRAILQEGADFSFRVQKADGATDDGAAFDFKRSWIYVTISLPEADPLLAEEWLTDSELLDIALSALPENHWALKQYQKVAGSLTAARWPETGVPYYFGGHSAEKVLHRYFPLQESKYYKSNRLYLCGFDCGSFLHWVEEEAGYLPQEELSEILKARAGAFPLRGLELREWAQALQPGDLLVFDHGTYHVGMVLGTPRMFGLTAENAPEAVEWLDAPLMIHCGEDPFLYDRFKAYIQAQDFRMQTTPPDGGVTVSLILPDLSEALRIREAPWGKQYGYFEILGQTMTVFQLADCSEIAWFRPVRPEGGS